MPIRAGSGFQPDYAVPPGETLVELLDETGMTQTELARRLGVSVKHVNQVIRGGASISAEFALGLEKVLGATADFWLNREGQYRADLARRDESASLSTSDMAEWASGFPIRALKARGFLDRTATGTELVAGLLRFFGIADPRLATAPPTAFRKSLRFESNARALEAWLRVGEIRAGDIVCADFDAEAFRSALTRVRHLTRLQPEEWQPQVVELCAQAGVAVVIEDTFEGARANGATRWLSPTKALLQLSLRYRWEDIFWFTFFHEAGHILLHRKKEIFIESKEKEGDHEWRRLEAEADAFAARALIPPEHDATLRDLPLSAVPAFADGLGIAPAIVVGRMQHDGLIAWNQGSHLRRRFVFS